MATNFDFFSWGSTWKYPFLTKFGPTKTLSYIYLNIQEEDNAIGYLFDSISPDYNLTKW